MFKDVRISNKDLTPYGKSYEIYHGYFKSKIQVYVVYKDLGIIVLHDRAIAIWVAILLRKPLRNITALLAYFPFHSAEMIFSCLTEFYFPSFSQLKVLRLVHYILLQEIY